VVVFHLPYRAIEKLVAEEETFVFGKAGQIEAGPLSANHGNKSERRSFHDVEVFKMISVALVSSNSFDFRTVVFAKHPQHVVLVHFPIALFITGVGLDLMAYWTKPTGTLEQMKHEKTQELHTRHKGIKQLALSKILASVSVLGC